jgi:hypothetical protein
MCFGRARPAGRRGDAAVSRQDTCCVTSFDEIVCYDGLSSGCGMVKDDISFSLLHTRPWTSLSPSLPLFLFPSLSRSSLSPSPSLPLSLYLYLSLSLSRLDPAEDGRLEGLEEGLRDRRHRRLIYNIYIYIYIYIYASHCAMHTRFRDHRARRRVRACLRALALQRGLPYCIRRALL